MKKIWIYLFMGLLMALAGNVHAMEVDILGGIDVHGFISQGYLESNDNNYLANNSSDGTFGFNEVGINFSKQLTDKLRIGLQLFSRDLGALGNNEIVLDWAFADYHWKDWLGVRVGRIKSPHGLYNEIRDADMLRTSIFLPQSIYNELARDSYAAIQGIGLYGNVPAGPVGAFSYNLLGGTMDVDGDDSIGAVRQFNAQPDFEVTGDFEFDYVYIAALEWRPPLDGLLLKYTYRTSQLDIPAEILGTTNVTYEINKHSTYVFSMEYTWNDLVLAAEYQKTRLDSTVTLDLTGDPLRDIFIPSKGYYGSATYRFNDWFEAGVYYSKYYDNTDDKNGSKSVSSFPPRYSYNYQAWLKDWALSLRFDINEYWVAKVEGHLMDGASFCLMNIDNDELDDHWYMFAAKLTFSF